MKMYFSGLGVYEMNNHVVVEYELDRRIGWKPTPGRATIVTEIYDCSGVPADARADMSNGEVWADGMARTLQRLDAACTRTVSG